MYNQKSKYNADSYHQSLKLSRFSSIPISTPPSIQSCAEGAQDIAVAWLFVRKHSRTLRFQQEKADALKIFHRRDGFFYLKTRQTIKTG